MLPKVRGTLNPSYKKKRLGKKRPGNQEPLVDAGFAAHSRSCVVVNGAQKRAQDSVHVLLNLIVREAQHLHASLLQDHRSSTITINPMLVNSSVEFDPKADLVAVEVQDVEGFATVFVDKERMLAIELQPVELPVSYLSPEENFRSRLVPSELSGAQLRDFYETG